MNRPLARWCLVAALIAGCAAKSEGADGPGCDPACGMGLACDRASRVCYDPEWPNWPMPNPRVSGLAHGQSYDVTSSPTVVKDEVTGLEWQRAIDPEVYDWTRADAYCQSLILAGHDDWRLPSAVELASIVNVLALAPAIDTAAFPETPAEYFWTSSRVASTEDVWWAVNFNTGYLNDNGAAAGTPHVRCVSGGRALAPSSGSGAAQRYLASPSSVRAPASDLTWQHPANSTPRDWMSAMAYCASLDLEGGGWRLPTVNELVAFTDYTRWNPALDPVFSDSAIDLPYWGSSLVANDPTRAWYLSSLSGNIFYTEVTDLYYARCVR